MPEPRRKGRRIRLVLLRALLDLALRLIMRRRFTGLENIPASGPCLLVFNHLSNFDPVLIFVLMRRVGRSDATGLVAAEYRRNLLHRFAIQAANGRWLRRGSSDRRALVDALRLLEDGWLVGIAPEGGRSRSGGLRTGRAGAAFLATRANVPIVALGLTGTEGISDSLRRLRRQTVIITAGPPFRLPAAEGADRRRHLERSTELIMSQIASLLPPEYRGAYADLRQLTISPLAGAPAARGR